MQHGVTHSLLVFHNYNTHPSHPMPRFLFQNQMFSFSDEALKRLPALASWWKDGDCNLPYDCVRVLPTDAFFLKHVDSIDKMNALRDWAFDEKQYHGLCCFTREELKQLSLVMCAEDGVNVDLCIAARSIKLARLRRTHVYMTMFTASCCAALFMVFIGLGVHAAFNRMNNNTPPPPSSVPAADSNFLAKEEHDMKSAAYITIDRTGPPTYAFGLGEEKRVSSAPVAGKSGDIPVDETKPAPHAESNPQYDNWFYFRQKKSEEDEQLDRIMRVLNPFLKFLGVLERFLIRLIGAVVGAIETLLIMSAIVFDGLIVKIFGSS